MDDYQWIRSWPDGTRREGKSRSASRQLGRHAHALLLVLKLAACKEGGCYYGCALRMVLSQIILADRSMAISFSTSVQL